MNSGRFGVGLLAVLLTVTGAAVWWTFSLRAEIAAGDRATAAVRRGVPEAEVAPALKAAGFQLHDPPWFGVLYDVGTDAGASPAVAREWVKRVDGGFLPIYWCVSVGGDGTVVGTHRYD